MKHNAFPWDSLLIVTMMLLATVCAQSQAAALATDDEKEGAVAQISPDEGANDLEIEPQTGIAPEPTYWIGIAGRSIESAVLRTHLQLAEDMGVVVERVLDDSPAAKAGLRKHDIILRVNGDAVDNMRVLQSQVRTGKDKPLELKIVRLGKQEKIVVVPEPQPANLTEQARTMSQRAQGMDRDIMQRLMQQFGGRNIGPGRAFRAGPQGFNFNQMPSGISVSIQRNNDSPAQITVKKGDQTWKIVGDDEESLKQLPDDVRPFVERMLNGQGRMQGFGRARLPDGLGDPMLERMEQMERQLEGLQKKMRE